MLERAGPTQALPYAPAPWVLRQCLESGFVYLENPPEYEAFKEEFAWQTTHQKESEARQRAEPVLYAASTVLKRLRTRILKRNKVLSLSLPLVRRASSAGSGSVHLLDIGCGWGALMHELVARLPDSLRSRCRPYGIELSVELSRIAQERFNSSGGGWCANATALDGLAGFEPGFFDLIIMSSFLEHEINPLPLLRRAHERLRPDGRIVVKVPNYACLNRGLRGARWCGFRWPDHVNYFTPQTLRSMAAQAGLAVARMRWVDQHPLSDNMYAIFRKA